MAATQRICVPPRPHKSWERRGSLSWDGSQTQKSCQAGGAAPAVRRQRGSPNGTRGRHTSAATSPHRRLAAVLRTVYRGSDRVVQVDGCRFRMHRWYLRRLGGHRGEAL